MTGHMCWCGRRDLSRFDEQYLECNCRTLVRASPPAGPLDEVLDEDTDLYGRNYWFERQQELGLPDLDTRARTDLHDRCVHWLAIVLGYVRPPARVLEIGTGHGAFLKLLTECGYVTTGVELSPCVAKYARARSGAPVLAGPLSHHHLAAKSFDLIVAFDVLEHLPDPLSALDGWTRLLRKDALLIVQTPCRPVELGPEDLALSRFGSMLIPEHLHLFTESSARELLRRAGLPCVTAEPPVFETDMILVASRTPMRANASISAADGLPPLVSTLVSVHAAAAAERQALRQELAGLDQQYQQANRDRTDRLARIHQLEREFARADEDRTARLNLLEQCEAELRDLHGLQRENAREIERLSAALAQADTDRVQRLERIHLLEEQYAQADRDRTARLADLEATNRHHEQQVRDLEARSAQREYLQREATAGEIERLNAELAQADTDRVQRLARIHVLEDLNAQADRDRLQHQEQTVREIERLGAALAQADADRVQRLERIHLLEGLYAHADSDRIARLVDVSTTTLRHEEHVRHLVNRT